MSDDHTMGASTHAFQTLDLQRPVPSALCEDADTSIVGAIGNRARQELSSMQELLGDHSDAKAFHTLERWTRGTLERIAQLVDHGEICLLGNELLPLSRQGWPFSRPVRLGVFPVAANPLHWLHVLGGLAVMERLRLDKVMYVVAGADPREPGLAAETIRHAMADAVLGLFSPLLEYSSMARGTASDGEENVFRIAASSSAGTLHVFYIAGSDHFGRHPPSSGRPDTIRKLEKGIRRRAHGFDPRRHKLSAVFLNRRGHFESVETFLDVRWIDDLPLHCSSTRIRGALVGHEKLSELSFLPYSVYSTICSRGLYGMSLGGHVAGLASAGNSQEGDDLL